MVLDILSNQRENVISFHYFTFQDITSSSCLELPYSTKVGKNWLAFERTAEKATQWFNFSLIVF